MAITVEIISPRRKIKAAKGRFLSDVLIESGIALSSYCRGRGVCGKCFVEILEGARPLFRDGEEKLLKSRGLGPDHRLACRYVLEGPVRLSIPPGSILERMPILAWGVETPSVFDPAVKKYYLEPEPPDLDRPRSLWDSLLSSLKLDRPRMTLDLAGSLPVVWEKSGGRLTAVVHHDREILALEAGDTSSRSFGLAVDLGTTTLVMDLVDLVTGRVVDSETSLNGQSAYGADVVSRLSLVYAEPGKAAPVRRAVLADLNRMLGELLRRNGLGRRDIYEVVAAGNTAMNHLFLGVPVRSLALAPFNPVFSTLPALPAARLGLDVHPEGRVYVAPNIKSFVGGDVAAGLLASGFFDKSGVLLYLDLGTNGEIALKKDGRVLATSTAAGPAFEGMNISHGMLAVPGAVYRVEEDGGPKLFTIGGGPPLGLCGTGLIDLLAFCLRQGLVTARGALSAPGKKVALQAGLVLNQKDVRELQLASAAVKSGMRMMLAAAGLRAADVDGLFIAGAFGNYLNIARTMSLGLLPSIDPDRIVFLGNAALAGARVLLLSLEARRRLESLVGDIQHFSLAAQPGFQEAFIGSLEFAPWS
jgi:uncharacterized 2Fe-2S/4Fe-4S cluster protein (DUF4445 family)